MKKILLVFVTMNCLFSSCSKDPKSVIPTCIQQWINQIKAQPLWNPPAEISEYYYNGQKVYLISADCCDQFNTLVDENCNTICHPGGGIAGNGDGKCADFMKNANFVGLVWKDGRTK